MENEFLTLEHEKLKIKYSNLKKILSKKNAIEAVSTNEEPIVPKLQLPIPVQNETPNQSECGTPRSGNSASNSVYVVPIPVFDIDTDDTDFHLDAATTVSTMGANNLEVQALFKRNFTGETMPVRSFIKNCKDSVVAK